eukprot:scaffold1318_cov388-Prasinococcus_capsulatus_cf.AAC.93
MSPNLTKTVPIRDCSCCNSGGASAGSRRGMCTSNTAPFFAHSSRTSDAISFTSSSSFKSSVVIIFLNSKQSVGRAADGTWLVVAALNVASRAAAAAAATASGAAPPCAARAAASTAAAAAAAEARAADGST